MSRKCPHCGEIKNTGDLDCDKCGSSGEYWDGVEYEQCDECQGQGFIEGERECFECGEVFSG